MPSPLIRSAVFQNALRRSYASSTPPPNVVDKAQKSAQSVVDSLVKAAGPTGSKIAQKVAPYQSKVVYNARLVGALAKQVYVAEKLAPPTSVGEITTAWATALGKASSKDYWVKLQKSGEWKTFALYGVQAYGLFTVGEMIGRRNIVGYNLVDNFEH